MSDISIDAREDDDVDIAVKNVELDFIHVSIGDVEIELTWEQGMALYRGLDQLFDDPKDADGDTRNTPGPTDTFGCACVDDDARTCARLRGVDEGGYRCQCECHVRAEEDAEDEEWLTR